jgi:hypothetical protein
MPFEQGGGHLAPPRVVDAHEQDARQRSTHLSQGTRSPGIDGERCAART